ncbi:hypothetical protein [Caballeronia glebae]|jgi:hypothetical protein|uniref:Lipoprotein n=1 Tax=Caballeronia glebae TaxID=1777143 RepID=A0A158ALJ2_9BURK|nr:hypothetical protein [Caballeronia glebae]SAK58758.1 hypothetical protein AWB82_02556 [Caballeronia glebae]
MKKLAAALLAASVTMPMLCYAQSPAPSARANAEGQSRNVQQSNDHHADYGASMDGAAQSGWATQPSAQALGQFVYKHR